MALGSNYRGNSEYSCGYDGLLDILVVRKNAGVPSRFQSLCREWLDWHGQPSAMSCHGQARLSSCKVARQEGVNASCEARYRCALVEPPAPQFTFIFCVLFTVLQCCSVVDVSCDTTTFFNVVFWWQ